MLGRVYAEPRPVAGAVPLTVPLFEGRAVLPSLVPTTLRVELPPEVETEPFSRVTGRRPVVVPDTELAGRRPVVPETTLLGRRFPVVELDAVGRRSPIFTRLALGRRLVLYVPAQ